MSSPYSTVYKSNSLLIILIVKYQNCSRLPQLLCFAELPNLTPLLADSLRNWWRVSFFLCFLRKDYFILLYLLLFCYWIFVIVFVIWITRWTNLLYTRVIFKMVSLRKILVFLTKKLCILLIYFKVSDA